MAGYKNLVKLSSLAYTEGFYTKPRVDRELLAKYSEGIDRQLGVPGRRESRTQLDGGRHGRARARRRRGTPTSSRTATTSRCRRTTPRARPSSTPRSSSSARSWTAGRRDERRALPARRRTTTRTTCCSASGSEGLRATRTGCTTTAGLYFKSAPEMRERSRIAPDVLENTLASPTRRRRVRARSTHVPSFPLPPGVKSENELLVTLATAGARERYGDAAVRRGAASGSTTSSA